MPVSGCGSSVSSEVVAQTSWMPGVHNYLRDLLTDAPQASWRRRGKRQRPEGIADVAIVRPRIRMTGWSGAPQVSGRGQVHVLFAIAYGTYGWKRVGYAQWVCNGHSTFPVLGEPKKSQDRCRKCFLLTQM